MSGLLQLREVAIVGLGLIGGSIARALRRVEPGLKILASSEDADDLEAALHDGTIDRGDARPDAVVGTAGLVIYAAPVTATVRMLERHARRWRSDAVVTDVGSVKRPVVAKARELGIGARFVGGHPMAGGHGSGFGAARADLFEGARVWLTPAGSAANAAETQDADPDDPALGRVLALWRTLDAEPACIDAEEHDRLVAWTSHLPQVVASALAAALAESAAGPDSLGRGGLDATRIAASPPALWRDILLQNAGALETPLAAMRRRMAELTTAIEAGDARAIEAILRDGSEWRRRG